MTDLLPRVAKAMSDRRQELIAQPLSRVWEELAKVAVEECRKGHKPAGWFNLCNDYHGYQQVAEDFEGEPGTTPLYAQPFQAAPPIAWESTTPCYIKFITDERYRSFSPEARRWYKPYRCSSCSEKETAHDNG